MTTASRPLPPDGYTVHDLLSPPDIPAHIELIDGWLWSDGPQQYFHSVMTDLLSTGLRGAAPPALRVRRQMTVVIDEHNAPEPDVMVVRAAAVRGADQMHFLVRDVLLAVEVVSPVSEARDRDTKPRKYAAAGIPYFWRVEMAGADDHPVVYAFELDPQARAYRLVDTFRERVTLGVPFPLDIDLTAIDRW
ncbi:Uma2 family endonuclease [Streptomyces chrestomyceticus]|uniref:Uma2 family endonuclease n=1 Tax=Streptomyces chrestomyceticus TaxID=68185 RepID=UPI0019CFDF13|nr:Uma2 family endonuclease [Streptomyces chrestomyceticus]